ncbi:MAG: cytochrome c-type biogenesis protein CcmH [Acidobacteriota bacterium]
MWRPRVWLTGALVLLAGVAFPASAAPADETPEVTAIARQLVCYCGCSGQTAAACTCSTAESIRDRIRQQLESGLSSDQVIASWVAERGEQILAVPTRKGFNLVGWIMPFLVTVLALAGLLFVLLRGRKPAHQVVSPPLSTDDRQYLRRIEDGVRGLRS